MHYSSFPNLEFPECAKEVQSVCLDKGVLIVGTKTGSIYQVDIVDQFGNINPKQNEASNLREYLDGIDNEVPQWVAHDQLQNRLCCLTKKGYFAVWDIETKLLIYSKSFNSVGKKLFVFRISGNILLAFDNELFVLSKNYSPFNLLGLVKTNITAIQISNNEQMLALAYLEAGHPHLTVYKIEETFKEMATREDYKTALIALDFSYDDSYLFAADELGNFLRYEIVMLTPIHKDRKLEVKFEWSSWGIRSDEDFGSIARFYSYSNKISAITCFPDQTGENLVAIGDETGIVMLLLNFNS